ncbi:Uncharacterized protein Rs2_38156 [Raphanus sativus]|nr:Uncharacterized protein Rs2_38156 [Raphanus sativus]
MSSDMQNKSNEAPAMIEPRQDCKHIVERTAALMNIATTNPQLRFIEFNDPRCYYFTQLVSSYPNKADGASIETLVNVFLQQLQLLLDKQDDDDGLDMSMSDLDAVVGCVDHMEDQESL